MHIHMDILNVDKSKVLRCSVTKEDFVFKLLDHWQCMSGVGGRVINNAFERFPELDEFIKEAENEGFEEKHFDLINNLIKTL